LIGRRKCLNIKLRVALRYIKITRQASEAAQALIDNKMKPGFPS